MEQLDLDSVRGRLAAMAKGFKIRCQSWLNKEYIYMDDRGKVRDEEGFEYTGFLGEGKWEVYE